ncbi:alpha/beta fold hydrolase [Clostridium formicaceticum]|uniref:Alpha/beta hydrolase n=1 Tax=Clostridium formicaceticum TaxID=1497 RepID=A0AAC9WFL6_9CLOT|nr:alpha/beta hydrolase [Clostridium formicaceticum]AOY76526.1 alpha/beta hydrolase [Clostridium formicaceticum]ARE86938.1 Carboxylesterase YbfK [Clostridium formicaceticum]
MKISEYHPFKSVESKKEYLKFYDKTALLWPVSLETKMIDTSYGKTFVRISGPLDAPALVLLPGAGASSLMWLSNIEALSKDYRIYAIDDIYGCGRSIYTQTINDSNDFIKWLDELFDSLELENNIHLMGMSYGGWQTSQYALRFPNKLNKIILLAPAATVLPISAGWVMRTLLLLLPGRYFAKNLIYWLYKDLVKKDKEAAEQEINFLFLALKCFKYKRLPNPTVLNDNELKNIKTPTLYLVGENERIYSTQKAVQRLNTISPRIKTEIISNAGHDLLWVQADVVNKKVLEFLKQS